MTFGEGVWFHEWLFLLFIPISCPSDFWWRKRRQRCEISSCCWCERNFCSPVRWMTDCPLVTCHSSLYAKWTCVEHQSHHIQSRVDVIFSHSCAFLTSILISVLETWQDPTELSYLWTRPRGKEEGSRNLPPRQHSSKFTTDIEIFNHYVLTNQQFWRKKKRRKIWNPFVPIRDQTQSCKKINDLDLKNWDHLIDLDLLRDLDHQRWSFLIDLDLDLHY